MYKDVNLNVIRWNAKFDTKMLMGIKVLMGLGSSFLRNKETSLGWTTEAEEAVCPLLQTQREANQRPRLGIKNRSHAQRDGQTRGHVQGHTHGKHDWRALSKQARMHP